MLTDAALRNLKPKSKIYKASDRDGMYVTVSPRLKLQRLRQKTGRGAALVCVRVTQPHIALGYAVETHH